MIKDVIIHNVRRVIAIAHDGSLIGRTARTPQIRNAGFNAGSSDQTTDRHFTGRKSNFEARVVALDVRRYFVTTFPPSPLGALAGLVWRFSSPDLFVSARSNCQRFELLDRRRHLACAGASKS